MQPWNNYPGHVSDREFEMSHEDDKYSKYNVRKVITQALANGDNHDEVIAITEYLLDKLEKQVHNSTDVAFVNYVCEHLLVDLITASVSDKNYIYLILTLDRVDNMLKY